MKVAIVVESITSALVDYSAEILREFRIDLDHDLLEYYKNNHHKQEYQTILTLRSEKEGGDFSGERSAILHDMISLDPEYIDLELDTDLEYLGRVRNSTPILSKHDYSQPMIETVKKFAKDFLEFQGRKDIVIKFVGDPIDANDLLLAITYLKDLFPRHILLGIGQNGIPSRTLADDFHQEFVFGASKEGILPSYTTLIPLCDPEAVHLGLLGSELSHSLSPVIHSLLLSSTNLTGSYLRYEVKKEKGLESFLELIRNTSILGLNVTFPFKRSVLPFCNQTEEVRKLNAANTLVFEDEIMAYNTDVSGFKHAFEKAMNSTGSKFKTALIVGAGGAARAVSLALSKIGIDPIVVNRTAERYLDWPDVIRENTDFATIADYSITEVDCYINATTVGYDKHSIDQVVPIPEGCQLVFDLNYVRGSTDLVKLAQRKGIPATDGKAMLFHQAVDAFELWTGSKVDRERTYVQFMEECG